MNKYERKKSIDFSNKKNFSFTKWFVINTTCLYNDKYLNQELAIF